MAQEYLTVNESQLSYLYYFRSNPKSGTFKAALAMLSNNNDPIRKDLLEDCGELEELITREIANA